MTHIMKASGPADLLAMIPPLVGFAPRNSIVILAFRGTRTCGTLRVDLPPDDARTAHDRVANYVVGTLCKIAGADSVVVAICTDDLFDGGSSLPHAPFAHDLGLRIEQAGFGLRELLCHAADGWASYHERRVPPGGHPLSEISGSAVAASVPDELRDLRPPPTRWVADAAPETVKRTAARIAAIRESIHEVNSVPVDCDPRLSRAEIAAAEREDGERIAARGLAPLTNLPILAEEALEWRHHDIDAHGALFLVAIQAPVMRDTVMLQWATSYSIGVRLWDESEDADPDGSDFDPDLAGLMLGVGPRPDPRRIERGIALLLEITSWVVGADRRAPLCMLGWLHWALGRSSEASVFVAEAREIDKHYGMAQLLEQMVSTGTLPEWAFADVT